MCRGWNLGHLVETPRLGRNRLRSCRPAANGRADWNARQHAGRDARQGEPHSLVRGQRSLRLAGRSPAAVPDGFAFNARYWATAALALNAIATRPNSAVALVGSPLMPD